jgi:hypothetical protein
MDDPRMRAGDAERNRVVEFLQRQVGAGRLTLEEFSERSAAAYRARTFGELGLLTEDLPVPVSARTTVGWHLPVPAVAAMVALVFVAGVAFLVFAWLSDAAGMGQMMDHMGGMMGR